MDWQTGWMWGWKYHFPVTCYIPRCFCTRLWLFSASHKLSEGLLNCYPKLLMTSVQMWLISAIINSIEHISIYISVAEGTCFSFPLAVAPRIHRDMHKCICLRSYKWWSEQTDSSFFSGHCNYGIDIILYFSCWLLGL